MTLTAALIIAAVVVVNIAALVLARAARMGDEMAARMERPGPVPGEWQRLSRTREGRP